MTPSNQQRQALEEILKIARQQYAIDQNALAWIRVGRIAEGALKTK